MKIKYVLDLMYGDADFHAHNEFVTEDEREIKFFDVFIPVYKELSMLSQFPLGNLNGDEAIKAVNRLIDAYNIFWRTRLVEELEVVGIPVGDEEKPYEDYVKDIEGANEIFFEILSDIREFLFDYDWEFHNSYLDYYGRWKSDLREDISNIGLTPLSEESLKDREKIEKAIELAVRFGGIDGAHHKTWVIDQMVRVLAGEDYDTLVKEACDGEDGPNTYDWDTGIAP